MRFILERFWRVKILSPPLLLFLIHLLRGRNFCLKLPHSCLCLEWWRMSEGVLSSQPSSTMSLFSPVTRITMSQKAKVSRQFPLLLVECKHRGTSFCFCLIIQLPSGSTLSRSGWGKVCDVPNSTSFSH